MDILFTVTYYRPHVSGLTVYVQRLAEELSVRGHVVTVLTSRFDGRLPTREVAGGVQVVRVPVRLRAGKGVVMPGYANVLRPLLKEADAVAVSLPAMPAEALLVPILARWYGKRPLAVYHCDVRMPGAGAALVLQYAASSCMSLALRLAARVVTYTEDYAESRPALRKNGGRVVVVPPPVAAAEPDKEAVRRFRRRHAPRGEPLIGFAARLATEKGAEVLLGALPGIRKALPGARVLFAGECRAVIGEERYRRRIEAMLEGNREHWLFLGVLNEEEMPVFYAACDVTVLPSLNATESFGLVQVESMLCGTPVVASDLPGVRVPVRQTGMGLNAPVGDSEALARAVIEVAGNRERYIRPRGEIEQYYSVANTAERYERLFEELA